MNIVVVPFCSDGYYCRPDTTLEKEPKDYYLPDVVTELSAAPVIFIKITKAGKSIGEKFAGRYYDSFGAGLLLYAENILLTETPTAFSEATSLDSSSYLPSDVKPIAAITHFACKLQINGIDAVDMSVDDTIIPYINEFISLISSRTSLRIGDIIAFETFDRVPVKQGDNVKVLSESFDYCFEIK